MTGSESADEDPDDAEPAGRELRLALAMRGGVSLAVWIGGCVGEIDRLRLDVHRAHLAAPGDGADGGDNALARLGHAVGISSVAVDVMSGASAGGLNAVLYGTALAAGSSVGTLRQTWQDVADLEKLQHAVRSSPSLSLFNGAYFRDRLEAAVVELLASGPLDEVPPPRTARLDVLLSVTSIVPIRTTTAIDPTLPEVERRVDALVRLHHRERAERVTSDFVAVAPGEPLAGHAEALALAGRATAAFPVAFAPVPVPAGTELHARIQADPIIPEPLYLYDGGVVDNMPVGKAARAIETAPADGPTTRLLLYLFPSPGGPDPQDQAKARRFAHHLRVDGAGPIDVGRSALNAFRGKSLAEDLRNIEDHNDAVRHQLVERHRLLGPVRHAMPGTWPPPSEDQANAELDVGRLVDLLVHPSMHLDGILPLPHVAPLLLGPSSRTLASVAAAAVARVQADPPEVIEGLPSLSTRSLRPWSAPIRIASLLIEWCRELEAAGAGPMVGRSKQRLYDLRDAAYRLASELNLVTITAVRAELDGDVSDPTRVAAALIGVRRGHLDAASPGAGEIRQVWADIVDTAVAVARMSGGASDDEIGGPDDPALRPVFALLRGAPPARAAELLGAIDRILLPMHQGSPMGSLTTIDYRTISGQAESPLSEHYAWPAGDGGDRRLILHALRVRNAERNTIDPGSKLAGNQLHNFAAFLRADWRANDWMWGRLDSVPTLVGVLLDPAHPPAVEVVEAIVRGQAGDPPRATVGPPWKATVDADGDVVWHQLRHLIADELSGTPLSGGPATADGLSAHPWPATRAALIWRRQAEVFAEERLGRSDPPGTDLGATMTAWDHEPRVLADEWGRTKTSAIAMRSASVAWRTLFEHSGPLRILRFVFTPVVMWLAGLFVGRRRSVVAVELVLAGVVLPRTLASGGRFVVAALVVAVAAGGLGLSRRRPRESATDAVEWVFIAGAVALALVAMVGAAVPDLVDGSAPPGQSTAALRSAITTTWVVVPTAAMFLATLVSWFWATRSARLVASLVSALLVGGWVIFAAQGDGVARFLRPLESLYWCVVIVIPLLYALVTFNVDVFAAKPPDPPSRPAPVPVPPGPMHR